MSKAFYHILLLIGLCALPLAMQAGNPDRQGEAGAYELLMMPYARSAGLSAMTSSLVTGVEAMHVNVAGMSRINKTEVLIGNSIYLQGTGINTNAFGLTQRVGKGGAFGFSLMALDFGDIPVTTTAQPEGTGADYSPSFFNLAFGYSNTFENKVSVGVLFRAISESISNVSAFGFGIDAGVQYVTGEKENFKFGISLRNIGSRMRFGGEGLSVQRPRPGRGEYPLTYETRPEGFELPSLLNLGMSYDIYFGAAHRFTVLGHFTAHSFSQDQVGGGFEYALKDFFMLRGAYRYEFGSSDEITAPIETGLSAGVAVQVPLSKTNKKSRLGIEYAYRQTRIWNGTHNFGVRFGI
jgi:hypothetical protein